MMSTALRGRLVPAALSGSGVLWLGYLVLVTVLIVVYLTLIRWGPGSGVDFACFRAASMLLAHGGNPYAVAQLWPLENALYNVPHHLHPGTRAYYLPIRYYNPALFATLLTPLARLPFAQGYAIYIAAVLVLAAAGSWLTLDALGWDRRRLLAIGIALVTPSVFLTAWYGQQSTLLLCALGATLYALRRGRPALAGALIALAWVKPHLLVPIALAAPLLLSPRAAARWYGGFGAATACGAAITMLTTGAGSIVTWLQALFGYAGYADAVQTYLPSLSGMAWVVLPHPWNKLAAIALTALGVGLMAAILARVRGRIPPWESVSVLVAAWLLFTPFAHAHDEVLLLPALAVAWGRDGARGRRPLPILALWTVSALSLAFLSPEPWKLLGVLPPILVFIAAVAALTPPAAGDRRAAPGPQA